MNLDTMDGLQYAADEERAEAFERWQAYVERTDPRRLAEAINDAYNQGRSLSEAYLELFDEWYKRATDVTTAVPGGVAR